MTAPQPCPLGNYCPPGTRLLNQFTCPAGYYNDQLYASTVTQCKPVMGGYYASTNGSTTPLGNGECSDGFYCEGGSNTPTPFLYTQTYNGRFYTNDQCPVGSYCPHGSNTSIVCQAGYFASGRGNYLASQCLPCPRSQYCSSAGAGSSSGTFCDPGYLCVSGNTVPNPTDGVKGFACPAGTYCTYAAMNTTRCSPGTFNPDVGQSNCSACLAGFYCSDFGQRDGYTCPLGSYCPAGASQPLACPVGSIGTSVGLTKVSDCTLCPPNSYCAGANSSVVTGPCAPGYFCDRGSATSMPSGPGPLNGSSALSGPCPAGHYCAAGTAPQACPQGTFLPALQFASTISQCFPCTAGSYCATQGLAAPTGFCFPGFTCPQGSPIGNAAPCPSGSYCIAPNVNPVPCPDGNYTNQAQQSSCKPCPARNYCVNAGTVPQSCPPNYYCK
jgi:hypothetical protein